MVQKQHDHLRSFGQDIEYLEAHDHELLEQYPEQWVAVFDQRVVGASADFDQLLTNLKRQGVPIGRAYIEFLTRRDDILILPS